MSKLAQSMELMQAVFDEHANGDGKLSKQELTKLLAAEFGLQCGCNKKVDEWFEMMDADKSGEVDFQEYVTFVAVITALKKECNA